MYEDAFSISVLQTRDYIKENTEMSIKIYERALTDNLTVLTELTKRTGVKRYTATDPV